MAEHYGLPSIGLGVEVVKRLQEGTLVFTGPPDGAGRDSAGRLVLTNDKTHPVIPTGHAVYAEVVARCLERLKGAGKPGPHALPAPLMADNWEQATTLPVEGHAVFRGSWERLPVEHGRAGGIPVPRSLTCLYRTQEPGASLTVRFHGRMVGIKGLTGPDSGLVGIQVDARPTTKENQFTVYSTRFRYVGSPLPELPEGNHTVTWTLLDEMPDKGAILASYYREGNDQDFHAHPEKYAVHRFTVGEILLIGDVTAPDGYLQP